jgi:hypothetical protein
MTDMTKTVDPSGMNVAFAGTMKGWKKSEIESRIKELGGALHKKPKKDTDIFLEGGKASYKTTHKALYYGATMLDHDAARALLDEGSFTPKAGGLTLDACIGDLRSLLDEGESYDTWQSLLGIIEQSDPERREEIVTYLDEQIDAWSGLTSRLDPMLAAAMSIGDVRTMPERWVAHWCGGHDASEYKLPRVLRLHSVGLTATERSKMFERDDWGSIHTLDLQDERHPTSFFKKMKKCKVLGQIRAVYVSCLEDESIEQFGAVEGLRNVKALHLVRSGYVGMTQGALLGASWANGVELMGLVHPSDYEDARTHADNLKMVRALVVRERNSYKATSERLAIVEQCLQQTEDHPVLQQIEDISLCFRRSLTDDSEFPLLLTWIDALSEDRAPSLKKIDLSGNQNVSFPDDLSRLLRALEKNNLNERLEAFLVPRDTAEDVLDKLKREGVPATRAS